MITLRTKMLPGTILLITLLACTVESPFTPTIPPAGGPTLTSSPTPMLVNPTATETASPATPTATATGPALAAFPAPAIQYLDMLDANNGWALTDADVARSLDGGANWYKVTPAGLTGSIAEAFFLDASTGWVGRMGADPTSGTLYHTTDGGGTWTAATAPFGGGSLHFVDAMHGWELVGLNAGMSHESVAIFRSDDGGATWTRVFINEPAAPGSSDSLPLVGDKNGITALDDKRAWVTGYQPSDDFIYVYMTQDGGSTWTHQTLSIPPGFSPAQTSTNLPVFFGNNEGVLPVLLFSNSNGADFYISQDEGQTWKATTPVLQGGHMMAASAKDFFVWDGGTTLNASHDAGASWATITPSINIKDNLVSVQFVNASTGWALTSDASSHHMLYKTSDGGATWSVLIP